MKKTLRFLSSGSLLIALAVEVGCSESPPAAPVAPTPTTVQAPTKPGKGAKRAPKDVASQQNNNTGLTQ